MKKLFSVLLACIIAVTTLSAVFAESVVPVKKIIIDSGKTINLPVGYSQQIKYTVQPEDASVKDVIWSSANEKVATVNDQGIVTAVAKGKTNVTAKPADGGKAKAVITVVVKEYDVVLKMSDSHVKVGFDTTHFYDGAVMIIGNRIMGDYDETTVKFGKGCVKSESNGVLIPVKPGEDTITVTVKHNGKKLISKKKYTVLVLDASEEDAASVDNRPEMRFLDIPWKATLAETEKVFSEKNYSLSRKRRYDNATFANVGEPLQFVDVPATYFTMYYSFVENEDGSLNSDEDKVFLFCVKGGFDTPLVDQLKQNIEEFYHLSDKDLVKEKDGIWEWTLGTVVLELNIWSDHEASMEMRDLDAESMRNKMIR